MEYRILEPGEIIQEGDEVDASSGWNDEARWVKSEHCIGQPAPDWRFPSHRIYRRKIVNTDQPYGVVVER